MSSTVKSLQAKEDSSAVQKKDQEQIQRKQQSGAFGTFSFGGFGSSVQTSAFPGNQFLFQAEEEEQLQAMEDSDIQTYEDIQAQEEELQAQEDEIQAEEEEDVQAQAEEEIQAEEEVYDDEEEDVQAQEEEVQTKENSFTTSTGEVQTKSDAAVIQFEMDASIQTQEEEEEIQASSSEAFGGASETEDVQAQEEEEIQAEEEEDVQAQEEEEIQAEEEEDVQAQEEEEIQASSSEAFGGSAETEEVQAEEEEDVQAQEEEDVQAEEEEIQAQAEIQLEEEEETEEEAEEAEDVQTKANITVQMEESDDEDEDDDEEEESLQTSLFSKMLKKMKKRRRRKKGAKPKGGILGRMKEKLSLLKKMGKKASPVRRKRRMKKMLSRIRKMSPAQRKLLLKNLKKRKAIALKAKKGFARLKAKIGLRKGLLKRRRRKGFASLKKRGKLGKFASRLMKRGFKGRRRKKALNHMAKKRFALLKAKRLKKLGKKGVRIKGLKFGGKMKSLRLKISAEKAAKLGTADGKQETAAAVAAEATPEKMSKELGDMPVSSKSKEKMSKLLSKNAKGNADIKEDEVKKIMLQEKKARRNRFSITRNVTSTIRNSRGGGDPLPDDVRSEMETAFGEDFSSVRVHTNGTSADLNKSLHAKAFTNRNDIHFNSGQYDPRSPQGKHLLAHELTHVVQQRSIPDLQRKLDDGGMRDHYENEADATADRVVTGSAVTTGTVSKVSSPKVAGVQTAQDETTLQFRRRRRRRRRKRRGLFSRIKKGLKKIGKKIKKGVKKLGKKIKKGLKKIGKAIKKGLKKLVKFVKKAVKFLKNLIRKLLEWVLSKFGTVGKNILKMIKMARQAIEDIRKNPKQFFKTLGKSMGKGFKQFAKNLGQHLIDGLLAWMTGDSNFKLEMPAKFNAKGIMSILMQVIGLTMNNVKRLFGTVIGESNAELLFSIGKAAKTKDWKPVVKNLLMSTKDDMSAYGGGGNTMTDEEREKAQNNVEVVNQVATHIETNMGTYVQLFKDIKEKGLSALMDFVREKFKDKMAEMKKTFIGKIIETVTKTLVPMLIARAAAAANPVGAIITVIDTVLSFIISFIKNFNRYLQLIMGFVTTFSDMAKGKVQSAADLIEGQLKRFIPLAMDLVMTILKMFTLPGKIRDVIKTIRGFIEDRILDVANFLAPIISPVINFVRKIIVSVKGVIGKGINAVKNKANEIKDKAVDKVNDVKDKIKGAFQERWSDIRKAMKNRHESEVGAHLDEDTKKSQIEASEEIHALVKAQEDNGYAEYNIDELNEKFATLKSKYQFSFLEAQWSNEEEPQMVIEFGFSKHSKQEKPGLFGSLIKKLKPGGDEFLKLLSGIGADFKKIKKHPVQFVKNLGAGLKGGFEQFTEEKTFKSSIKNGFFAWFSGSSGASITIPKTWNLKSVMGMIIEIAGLGINSIKNTAAKAIGDPIGTPMVDAVSHFVKRDWKKGIIALVGGTGVTEEQIANAKDTVQNFGGEFMEIMQAIKDRDFAVIWNKVSSSLATLKEDLLAKVVPAILTPILGKIAAKLASILFSGGWGAILEGLKAIWGILQFIFGNAAKMASMVSSLAGVISAFANNAVETGSTLFLKALQSGIPLAIDLIVKMLGLSKLVKGVKNAITAVGDKVKTAITNFIKKIKAKVSTLFNKIKEKLKKAGTSVKNLLFPETPFTFENGVKHTIKIKKASNKYKVMIHSTPKEMRTYINDSTIDEKPKERALKRIDEIESLALQKEKATDEATRKSFHTKIKQKEDALARIIKKEVKDPSLYPKGTANDRIPIVWFKTKEDYPTINGKSVTDGVKISTPSGNNINLKLFHKNLISEGAELKNIKSPDTRNNSDKVARALKKQDNKVDNKKIELSINMSEMQVDHVKDIAWEGKDLYNNLWPVHKDTNMAFNASNQQRVRVVQGGKVVIKTVQDLRNKFFKVAKVERCPSSQSGHGSRAIPINEQKSRGIPKKF